MPCRTCCVPYVAVLVLCYAVLYCVVLCCVELCCVVLCYVVWCCAVLCCAAVRCVTLCGYVVLRCAEGAVTRRQWLGCLPTGTGKHEGCVS